MIARTTAAASIAALALALAGCGGKSKPGLEVGACTNADPTQLLSFDVKAVDCGSKDAKSKVVRAVVKSDDCDVASVADSANHKVYCTEPYPPGSAPTKPAVGACTTADPKQLVSVNIRLVSCGDKAAKSKIVRRVANESQCAKGSVRGKRGEVFCIVPV
ncbi:MAG: hypothetical protein QOE06_3323 [Thermoleophilaceae bacterium]|nr:hypothetical protein [Thermoleophilaceae bacterium]